MKQAIPKNQKLSGAFFVLVLFCLIAAYSTAMSKGLKFTTITNLRTKADSITYTLLFVDQNEASLHSVQVKVKNGDATIKTTKQDGTVKLAAKSGDVIQIYIGDIFIMNYTLTDNKSPIIVLSSKSPAVESIKDVNLLYNTTLPPNLTAASTEVVYTNDLTKMPVVSVKNALAGRFAGLSTSQSNGQPGADEVSVSLRGQSPLVVIDGIPRSITTIDLEEIESVTILKDALATAMFGIRASNGVILITTRKGTPSKQRISFTAQSGIQEALKMPQPLDAYDYAVLRNQAVANEASVGNNYSNLLYSPTDLQAFKTGSDPIGHPNVNWGAILFKSTSMLTRYSLNISGGNNDARYFVSFEDLKQTGFLNTLSSNTYNTNNELNNYVIRSNIDFNVTPKLVAGVHLLGKILTNSEPAATNVTTSTTVTSTGIAGIYAALLTTPDNAYPQLNTNGSYGGSQQYQNNLYAQATGSGYLQSTRRDILADFYLKRSLDDITPGLWVKALGSYSSTVIENIVRSKPYITFNSTPVGVGVATYTQFGVTGLQVDNNNIGFQSSQNYFELSMGYTRTFNKKHGLNIVLLANSDNSTTGQGLSLEGVAPSGVTQGLTLPYTVTGTSGRLSYNYEQKYVLEAAYGLNGSNYYQTSGNITYAFFPAFGAAWNIDKEDFLKNYDWISSLKLFGSYGKTGNDTAPYFPGIQRYNGTTSYFGTAAGATASLAEATLANPNETYEKADKLNLGLRGALFSNHLGFTAEYYNNKFYDLLIQRGQATSILGATYPVENIGQNRYTGWDLQLKWQKTVNSNFSYFVGGVVGLQQSKVLYSDEVTQPYSYLQRTGQKVGQAFGYTAIGLIQTPAEAASTPTFVGYTPQPGDIKYLDRNHDGVINQLDQSPIGPTGPAINFGLNLGFTYKSFDFSTLIQGAANRDVYLNGNSYWEFQNGGYGQAYPWQLNAWTPANAATATYPRLSIGNNTNNDIFSTYWYRPANFARLKNIELGYTLPDAYTRFIRIKSARIFVNGTNLFTVTQLKDVDPEDTNGAYPIQKIFNIGINIKL